ncbi:MAG TPA: hypothetical protein VFQ77_10895 [Pseudonocardiaceae bacterium]|jgi:hypothetical protein|nr:hypothetical protein [Pseudonocardiaceae bacterium]
MSTPQDPYASRSGDLPLAPSSPPAGWPGPAGGPLPPAPVTRPGTVVAAVVCWLLAGLILIFSGAVTVAAARTQEAKNALADLFAKSQVQISEEAIEQLLIGTGLAAVAVGLLTIVFGTLLLGGANWARITVTVLGVLGVLIVLLPAPLVLLALVLQFVPSSNAWFRTRSAHHPA